MDNLEVNVIKQRRNRCHGASQMHEMHFDAKQEAKPERFALHAGPRTSCWPIFVRLVMNDKYANYSAQKGLRVQLNCACPWPDPRMSDNVGP